MRKKDGSTKNRILEEAIKLFAQNGYMGTSMSEIAERIGITKAALYKHYTGKQEILESIVEKMNRMDTERSREYAMPEGNMEDVVKVYRSMTYERIKEFTLVQFRHWTEEEFASCFRKMLTLEQYRSPELAQLYAHYLTGGPFDYMEKIFYGLTGKKSQAKQLAQDFYGPIFLLYSIYDGAEDKEGVVKMAERHMEHFEREMEQLAK